MLSRRSEIETLVMAIQDEFLQSPAIRLTLEQIARRVDASLVMCRAILRVLVDARVIEEMPGGVYQQFVPAAARGYAA